MLPTRLLVEETTPLTPVVPLPQVTAPASATAPLSQVELRTIKLPLVNAVNTQVADGSFAVLPVSVLIRTLVAPLYR